MAHGLLGYSNSFHPYEKTMKVLVALARASLFATMALFASAANAVLITFDTDAVGNALAAPSLFINTVALTNLYAPLGVTFAGPGGNDGGAILNQSGNFGVNALSSPNFLAFNRGEGVTLSDGGRPIDPETITFASPVTSVSIFAAGGALPGTFEMEAFDEFSASVDIDTVTTADFAQLTVSGPGIVRVVLGEQTGKLTFVYDNLEFNAQAVPEPAGLALLGIALAGLAGFHRRRPA